MADKLFFGEIERQSKEAVAKYMASRGKHGKDSKETMEKSDLEEYNREGSEVE